MTTSDELERENRHFVMSEAIIEAMEQAKQVRPASRLPPPTEKGVAKRVPLSAQLLPSARCPVLLARPRSCALPDRATPLSRRAC